MTNYVYLKRWSLPGGTAWHKIGITNSPLRREAEQNVLPVPAETLACVNVGDRSKAFAVETAIRRMLIKQNITGAGNRELFHLEEEQVAALLTLLDDAANGSFTPPPVPDVATAERRRVTPITGLFTFASYRPSESKPEHVQQWDAIRDRILKEGPLTFEQLVTTIKGLVSDAQRARGGAPAMVRYMIKQLGALVPA
ncbi:GIY-YIG nuclease family protein [Synechococcus sp. EJ6-Ellesmere]|uniref:GIY-YIG nuclease family protein n=1 Tax=Synechococcus sp. EJ6-Ellesmere TaxID=2823734 RepID=UPI0020CE5CA0|nr:GIY-YIG nuclease family protein [Synechococcus sp. EJ6-Ellesmere]MCP9826272.1 GIY-YIG nuclease family protein [Synechococcus sp. EJ6-Ellesmere]